MVDKQRILIVDDDANIAGADLTVPDEGML